MSLGGNMAEENLGGDVEDIKDAGFSVVFEEKNPNSPYVSRPIFRFGNINFFAFLSLPKSLFFPEVI